MKRSDEIAELAKALAAAQAEMKFAIKGSENPHFKSKFAGLPEVMEVARILSKHGIALMQPASSEDGKTVAVETVLAHSSGQWASETLRLLPMKADPQGIGSAITYARRYGLTSFVGIAADEDDDGNAASTKAPAKQVHTDAALTETLRASVKPNGNGGNGKPQLPAPAAASQTVATTAAEVDEIEQRAATLIEACEAGFKSKEHQINWFKKHVEEINSLGKPFAPEVVKAYHAARIG